MTKLKQVIQKSGLKQVWLADQLGVNAHTVSRWVKGLDKPRVDQAQHLARLLNVSVESLFPLPSNDTEARAAQAASSASG